MAMFHQSFAGRDLGALLAPYHSRATTAATDKGVDGVLRVVDRSPNAVKYTDNLNLGSTYKRGTCVVTPDAFPMSVGTRRMSLVAGLGVGGTNDVYSSNFTGYAPASVAAFSFRIDKQSATGTLEVKSASGSQYGRWLINLSLVAAGEQRITATHPAVTVIYPFIADPSGWFSWWFCYSSGSGSIYLGGVNIQPGVTDPNFTEWFHAGDNSRPAFDGAGGLILEAARAQLLYNTGWSGAVSGSPGTAATAWANYGSGTFIRTVTAIDLGNSFRTAATVSTERPSTAFNNISVTNGVTYCFSVKVNVHTSLNVQQILYVGAGTATLGTVVRRVDGVVQSGTYSVPTGVHTLEHVVGAASTGTFHANIGIGCLGNTVGDVTFYYPQFEAGSFRSSHIINTSTVASLARAASYVGPVLLTDMGIAPQMNEHTVILRWKFPYPSSVTPVAQLIALEKSGVSFPPPRLLVYDQGVANQVALMWTILGVNYFVSANLTWVAGETVLFAFSRSAANGVVFRAKNTVVTNTSANAKAPFEAPLDIMTLGPSQHGGSCVGFRVLDRALTQAELEALTANIFDIPETGLLTRKPTNSLTKLLTRPIAA